MLKILRDSDTSIIISQVKGEDNLEAIFQPSDIPPTVTKLQQYIYHLFPNAKGVNLNLIIRLSFNGDQDMITYNVA